MAYPPLWAARRMPAYKRPETCEEHLRAIQDMKDILKADIKKRKKNLGRENSVKIVESDHPERKGILEEMVLIPTNDEWSSDTVSSSLDE